jgi:kynurenine formamidase
LTTEAVQYLVDLGVKAIGLDTPSLDNPDRIGLGAPGHLVALGAGIPIFESLTHLKEVVGKRFLFVGTPLKLDKCEASPIRAIAIIE